MPQHADHAYSSMLRRIIFVCPAEAVDRPAGDACARVARGVLVSLRQKRLYQASAQVLISRNLANVSTARPTSPALQQADRVAQTQAELARVPAVAKRALDSRQEAKTPSV